jgi:large subunit ribosomal protein L13
MSQSSSDQNNLDSADWYIIDAKNLTLGRLATRVADIIQGKHKLFSPAHKKKGDIVIITNVDTMYLGILSKYLGIKRVVRYPGRPGNSLKYFSKILPREIIERAVRRMLPVRLRSSVHLRLRVYNGSDHSHDAQNPTLLEWS